MPWTTSAAQEQTGWWMVIIAVGMLCGLIGTEMAALHEFNEILTVPFIGKTLLHIATVISAWAGGKLMPQFESKA